MPTLFDPLELGDLTLPNRDHHGARSRAAAPARAGCPNASMSEYYAQRASAGLIISEATSVSPMGVGYPDTPGIWSRGAGRGLEARHARRAQRRRPHPAPALARRADVGPVCTWTAQLPVAPSAIAPDGHTSLRAAPEVVCHPPSA